MDQRRIKELLIEASSSDCDSERLTSIQSEFEHETAALREDGTFDIEGPDGGLRFVVGALFVSTASNRREAFPSLLPVFSLLCGDREGDNPSAEIDWSLVDKPEKS